MNTTKELDLKQFKRHIAYLYELTQDAEFDINDEEMGESVDFYLDYIKTRWLILTDCKYEV